MEKILLKIMKKIKLYQLDLEKNHHMKIVKTFQKMKK